MARQHVMTPTRKAALRKAQLASAAKRRKGAQGPSAIKRKSAPAQSVSQSKRRRPARRTVIAAASVAGSAALWAVA